MNIDLDIATGSDTPEPDSIIAWAHWASGEIDNQPALSEQTELAIRIVNIEEIQSLNAKWRQKDRPTNVLSFPYEPLPGVDLPLLGDIVLCAEVANQEAHEQNKEREHHWAHLIVHSVLHLRGYDHIKESEAEHMEHLERQLLAAHGLANPYE